MDLQDRARELLERADAPGTGVVPPTTPQQTHQEPSALDAFVRADVPKGNVTPNPTQQPQQDYVQVRKPMSDEEFAAYIAAQNGTPPATPPAATPPAQMSWPSHMSTGEVTTQGNLTQAPATPAPPVAPVAPAPVPQPPVDDLGESTIITSAPVAPSTPPKMDDLSDETIVLGEEAMKVIDGMDPSLKSDFLGRALPDIKSYQKELIVKEGLTPSEAMEAARNRATKWALTEAKKWAEEHPNGVIVTIDKKDADTIEFTDAERAKMQSARALKLIVVENAELEHLRVLPNPRKVEMSSIRNICGSLAQYSIPVLSLGDYMTFHGAQSGFLASCCVSEDDTMLDAIEKKASILYSCFDGGVLTSRFKADKPNEAISYEDFCNIFHYEDIDLGIYAVVTASAMEETESSYQCLNRRCQHIYPVRYNQKALLDLSDIPQVFKDRVQAIDENRANLEGMRAIHNTAIMCDRVKSPITQNVYELGSATIAEARKVIAPNMRLINESTAIDLVLLLYARRIWLYDHEAGGYLEPIDVVKEPTLAFQTICAIHQADVELLSKHLHETRYTAKFRLKTKCPNCGREAVDDLDVDDMVFLHARGTLVEIHQ